MVVASIVCGVFFLSKNDTPHVAPFSSEDNEERFGGDGGADANPSLAQVANMEITGREFTLGEVLEERELYVRYYIEYKSGDLTISGIMNMPRGEGPFPVLFLNHGYIDTAVYTNGRGLVREQEYFASRGYVVVHSDYRNHANSTDVPDSDIETFRLGYAQDVVNGIYALRAANLEGVDATRIGMLGHSMGGGIAQQIMVTHPDLVNAVMLYAAISSDSYENFDRWVLQDGEVSGNDVLARYGSPEENPEFWKRLSTRSYHDNGTAPVQLHHGTADEDVPVQWSSDTATSLRNAGREVELFEYEGEGHEFSSAWPTVMARTLQFFDKHVKGS